MTDQTLNHATTEDQVQVQAQYDFKPTPKTDAPIKLLKTYFLLIVCLIPLLNIVPLLYHLLKFRGTRTQVNMVIAVTVLSYPLFLYYIGLAYALASTINFY